MPTKCTHAKLLAHLAPRWHKSSSRCTVSSDFVPSILYLQFHISDSVPPMHRPINSPMHRPIHPPIHRPMHHLIHHLIHPQILTRWAPWLAQPNCATQCQLYLARLQYGFTNLTSYPVYMAALVFSCIQSCQRC